MGAGDEGELLEETSASMGIGQLECHVRLWLLLKMANSLGAWRWLVADSCTRSSFITPNQSIYVKVLAILRI
jgi:hypothetical protein